MRDQFKGSYPKNCVAMLRLLLKAPGCTSASELAEVAAKHGNAEAFAFLLSGEVGVRITPSLLLAAAGSLHAEVMRAALAVAHTQHGSAATAAAATDGGDGEAMGLLSPVAVNTLLGHTITCASEQGIAYHTPDALATVKLLVEEAGANPRANVRMLGVEQGGSKQKTPTLALNTAEPRGALWALLGSYHTRDEILHYLLDACRCSPDGELEPLVAGAGAAELPSRTDTPLSCAISQSHWDAVQLLLTRGANGALVASGQAMKLMAAGPQAKKARY